MKKITRRAILCLVLAAGLVLGLAVYVGNWLSQGDSWATYVANDHLYANGRLLRGQVADRNGVVLATAGEGGWRFHDSAGVRKATLHAVGDSQGMIGGGAINAFTDRISGYNLITGAKPILAQRQLRLTLDAELCRVAREAMGSYHGTIGVYDYRSGAILCLVSAPSYDPADPPQINDGDPAYEGAYLNRLLAASFTPGSTFKLVTAIAALENLPGVESRSFHCDGVWQQDGASLTCPQAHGDLTLAQALSVSCNCVFGALSLELGAETLAACIDRCGLTSSYSVNGLTTAVSSFVLEDSDPEALAWSGVGQGQDLVNPCAMMVLAGAIANQGQAATPQLISSVRTTDGLRLSLYLPRRTRLLSAETADSLAQMMRNNVTDNYGAGNFPGLALGAKSGTAQTGSGEDGWFVGFLSDPEHPLAFVALLEGSGAGREAAARAANAVLQAAVAE